MANVVYAYNEAMQQYEPLENFTGKPGPNAISADTTTAISGLLMGKDGKVSAAQPGANYGRIDKINNVPAGADGVAVVGPYDVGAASNRNLFDNWYFVGGGQAGNFPVNQRGAAMYTGYGYCIDRWVLSDSIMTLLPDKVSVQFNTANTSSIATVIPVMPYGEYTVSALLDSGLVTTTINWSGEARYGEFGDNFECLFSPATHGACAVYLFARVQKTVNIIATKLEEGPRQTLARQENGALVLNDQPPDYGQELSKCQRYAENIPYYSTRTHENGNADIFVPYKVTKRSPAAVTAKSMNGTPNNVSYWNGTGFIDIVCTIEQYANGFRLMATADTADRVIAFEAYAIAEL